MFFDLDLPQSLEKNEHRPSFLEPLGNLSHIKIHKLSPSQRNRIFMQYSSIDGQMTPNLEAYQKPWTDTTVYRDRFRYHPDRPVEIEKDRLPRSRMVDTFFSHQLPGMEDSALTDARKLIKLQTQIQKTADAATKQYKLALFRMSQLVPEQHIVQKIMEEDPLFFEPVLGMLEEEESFKIPHCNNKLISTTISAILEHTDNVTADFTNGTYNKPLNIPEKIKEAIERQRERMRKKEEGNEQDDEDLIHSSA